MFMKLYNIEIYLFGWLMLGILLLRIMFVVEKKIREVRISESFMIELKGKFRLFFFVIFLVCK